MNNFLFVCSVNMMRSPTAEHVARKMGWAADSAGTDSSAVRPLTQDAIDRAARVVCMEESHRKVVMGKFKVDPDKVRVWNVPDEYDYCQPSLVRLLKKLIEEEMKDTMGKCNGDM